MRSWCMGTWTSCCGGSGASGPTCWLERRGQRRPPGAGSEAEQIRQRAIHYLGCLPLDDLHQYVGGLVGEAVRVHAVAPVAADVAERERGNSGLLVLLLVLLLVFVVLRIRDGGLIAGAGHARGPRLLALVVPFLVVELLVGVRHRDHGEELALQARGGLARHEHDRHRLVEEAVILDLLPRRGREHAAGDQAIAAECAHADHAFGGAVVLDERDAQLDRRLGRREGDGRRRIGRPGLRRGGIVRHLQLYTGGPRYAPVARRSRSRAASRPTMARSSFTGSETVDPVSATRTGCIASPSFVPDASALALSASRIASGL